MGWWPLLPGGRLDGEPPLEDGCAEPPGVHIVTTRISSGPLLELPHLSGPIAGGKGSTHGLSVVLVFEYFNEKYRFITKFGYPSLAS